MLILDTDVLSELTRVRPADAVIGWLKTVVADDLATTAVTAAELEYGVGRMPDGERKRGLVVAIKGLLDQDPIGRIRPFDRECAGHYADLAVNREQAGRPISRADAQIAAICRRHGAALATRNTRDFAGIGLALINPWTTT